MFWIWAQGRRSAKIDSSMPVHEFPRDLQEQFLNVYRKLRLRKSEHNDFILWKSADISKELCSTSDIGTLNSLRAEFADLVKNDPKVIQVADKRINWNDMGKQISSKEVIKLLSKDLAKIIESIAEAGSVLITTPES